LKRGGRERDFEESTLSYVYIKLGRERGEERKEGKINSKG
jgi:hypothetical protein